MRILSIIGLLLLPAAVSAQAPEPDANTVAVSATGTVSRAPDQAVIMLAVESLAATARAATEANAARMDAVLAALRGLGLAGDRVRTVAYQVDPEYDFEGRRRPGEERIVGYRARNMVQVTVDTVARVGRIIDAAIEAGANRVTGLNFQIRDPEAARREALRRAVATARAEAESIADALGRRLGPAVSVSTAGPSVIPRPMVMRTTMMDEAAVPTPIEPGALDVTASIHAVFRLEPR